MILNKVANFFFIFSISFNLYSFESFKEMATSMAKKFKAPTINISELETKIHNSNVIVLDARELEEYNVSHIEGANHVGYKDFNLEKTLKKIPNDSLVIVYCSVGYRSGEIAQKLRESSINALNLFGGIFNWKNSNKALVDNKNIKTNKIHGYNKSWSKWINKGEVILPKKKSLFDWFN